LQPLEDLIDALERNTSTFTLQSELRLEDADATLSLDEFLEQGFTFRAQALVILEKNLDGVFEAFEIVLRGSRRGAIARAVGVHAIRLHDPASSGH
jgi:hypothetical protein